ncbi:MAG: peptide deformylase [Bacillota bacterium]
MALRKILKDNHPTLRTHAQEVKKINSPVLRLLDDMLETMRDASGVGLAANQVGVPKRILVAANGEEGVYELINPFCEKAEGEALGVEGCLSVPGCYGEVPRSEKIVVKALNREGQPVKLALEGLAARIIQHEMDHLDGVLFTDKAARMIDPEELKSEEKS